MQAESESSLEQAKRNFQLAGHYFKGGQHSWVKEYLRKAHQCLCYVPYSKRKRPHFFVMKYIKTLIDTNQNILDLKKKGMIVFNRKALQLMLKDLEDEEFKLLSEDDKIEWLQERRVQQRESQIYLKRNKFTRRYTQVERALFFGKPLQKSLQKKL